MRQESRRLPEAADGIIEAIVLRGKFVSTLLVLLALGAWSCSSPSRKVAPNFTLKDSDGRAVQLADYRGKVVLLNFWATWCGPCKIEIPWFTEFERRHKDRGFAVVGISMDEEGWDAVKPFISEYRINYRVLMGNVRTAELYGGVEALPTTFLIDREGRIAAVHEGLVSRSRYERDLIQLLDSSRGARGARGAGQYALLARAK
jgi:cytochrome c biogenesis protein CcmG/thiol:disulfide interchange protein DsbE